MNKLKKLIAMGVTVSMLLSLMAVMPVNAATIADGDLVKTADSSAVYYIQGANKRVFPHANVYLSWGYDADYATVKTVTSSELAAYTDANAMPFRDGALFRGTAASLGDKDATAVFYVENAVLRPVLSEQVYQGLFSDTDWAKVTWVPDDLLTKFNYDMGENLTTSTTHPNGVVFMYSGSAQKYVIEDGNKRAISDTAFAANRYRTVDVLTLETDEVYSDGSSITGVESGILTPGWIGTTVAAGTISSSLVSIAGATVPKEAENISVLSVRFTAGSSAATVTGLTFKRLGMGLTTDWDNFYLYEGNALLTASGRSLGSDSHEVEFPTISVSIPANSSKTITLRGDGSSTAAGGELHSFQLKAVETTATVTGLPLTGNTFTVGQVAVESLTVAAGAAVANPSVGATGVEIATLKLTAGNNDIEFSQMVLTFSGSLSTSAVTNLKLYRESTLLASASGIASDDTVTFTLTSPYTITESQEKSFSIKADIGGSGKVGESLVTKIEETNHVFAIDKTYNFGANVNGPSVQLASLELQGGELTMANNGPSASDITKNVQDVTLLSFAMTSDRQVEVKRLEVALSATTALEAVIASDKISDLKIKDADTGSTLMSKALSASTCIAGELCEIDDDNGTRGAVTAGTWNAEGQDNRWQLTDSFYLAAGVTRNLIVTVDIGTATANEGKTIAASVSEVWYDADQSHMKDVSTGDYLITADIVPNTIDGKIQSIVASSLTASEASTPVSALTAVKGATKVDGIGVVLRAGDGSAIKVTQLPIRVYVDMNTNDTTEGIFIATDEDTTPKGEITAVYLYDDTDTLLGTKTLTNTSGTVYGNYDYGLATFDGLDVNIAAGSTEKLIVKFDVSSEAGARDIAVGIVADDITAYDADDSTVDATGDINLVGTGHASYTYAPNYTHISTEGTLTVGTDSSTPDSDIVLAGTSDVVFSKIKFTAEKENWTVKELRVDLVDTDNESSIENIKVAYTSGNTDYSMTGSLAGGYADFSNMNWVIPKDTEQILTISADLAAINASIATTGRTLQLGVSSTASTFKADGESGSQDVSAEASNGNKMYLRKSIPIIIAGTPDTSIANSEIKVSEFTVTASGGPITLKKLSWKHTPSDMGDTRTLSVGSWKIYDTANSSSVISSVWSDGDTTSTSDIAVIATKTMIVEFDEEEEIAENDSKTFYVLATVTGAETDDKDSFSFNLINTADSNGINDNLTGSITNLEVEGAKLYDLSVITSYSVDFLWSDKARGLNHSETYDDTAYEDWSNGYLLNTFPINNTID